MSKLLEFLFRSILIVALTIGLMFFSALQFVLKAGSTAECAWHGSARAWLDSNGDGLVNRGEPPLAEVKIHVKDSQDQVVPLGADGWTAQTDRDGGAQFNIPVPGCADTTFQIYADAPTGYRLTTLPRVEAHSDLWSGLGPARVFYFGFFPER